ncbi:hypothetical protein PYW08_004907 [Mythimna loreyi]|uniref:Uncharacterized protein n=1 Tax=Mythimna loreyi TaxID=667449 RepID=A0ACC2QEP2_9NEOP|nr:hypothetical protein PYW08_004907 [Mythimna loreyi]
MINGCELKFKIDTGADVNVLPCKFLEYIKLDRKDLLACNLKLRGYSGGDIKVIGKCNLKLFHKGQPYVTEFIIADVPSPPIIGKDSCEHGI